MTESINMPFDIEIPPASRDSYFIPRRLRAAAAGANGREDELALDISPDSDFEWPEVDIEALAQNAPVYTEQPPIIPEQVAAGRLDEIISTWVSKSALLEGYVQGRLGSAGDFYDAGDIVQSALERFMRTYGDAPPDFHDEEGMGFLFTMLKNATTDAHRQAQRLRRNELIPDFRDLDSESYQRGYVFRPPDSSVLAASSAEALGRALGTIPPTLKGNSRAAFEVLQIDPNISNEELALQLGVKVGNARTIRKRVLDKALDGLRAYAQGRDTGFQIDLSKEVDRKTGPPETPKKATVRTAQLQSEATEWIQEQVASGGQEPAIYVPPYIGAWTVAAAGMQQYFKQLAKADEKPGLGVIAYPHEALLPDLEALVKGIVGKTGPFIIDTPANIAVRLADEEVGYAVLAGGLPEADDGFRDQLKQRSRFLLHLLSRPMSTTMTATHIAPSYKTIGRKNIQWEPGDSIRYLQEWRLAAGNQLTEEKADAQAKAGTGPSLKRLLTRVGSFAALMSAAGYSFEAEDRAFRPTASVA